MYKKKEDPNKIGELICQCALAKYGKCSSNKSRMANVFGNSVVKQEQQTPKKRDKIIKKY